MSRYGGGGMIGMVPRGTVKVPGEAVRWLSLSLMHSPHAGDRVKRPAGRLARGRERTSARGRLQRA